MRCISPKNRDTVYRVTEKLANVEDKQEGPLSGNVLSKYHLNVSNTIHNKEDWIVKNESSEHAVEK